MSGKELEQWQVEPTGAGRIWFAIDDDEQTIWIMDPRLGTLRPPTRRRKQR